METEGNVANLRGFTRTCELMNLICTNFVTRFNLGSLCQLPDFIHKQPTNTKGRREIASRGPPLFVMQAGCAPGRRSRFTLSTSRHGVIVASGTTPKSYLRHAQFTHLSEAVTVRERLRWERGRISYPTGRTDTISRTIVVTILCIRDLRDSRGHSGTPISSGSPRDRLSGGVAHCRRIMGDEEITPARTLTRKSDLKRSCRRTQ